MSKNAKLKDVEDLEEEIVEILKPLIEENQTRKILDILSECQNLDVAILKVKALIQD